MSPIKVAQTASNGVTEQHHLPTATPDEGLPRITIGRPTIADHKTTTTKRRAAFGSAPDVLADICEDEIHLAVWQRSLSPALVRDCQAFMDMKGFNSHRMVLPTAKARHLSEVLPGLDGYPHVRADIELLADMYSCLFDLSAIGLRLTTLTDTMCPKFHVDRVPCRLITTYAGAGTEWLPHDYVDRSILGAGSGGLSDAKSGLYPATQPIQSLAAGDVAILKGELWKGNEGAGLVHRSPAIEPGSQRLILTFDFASP